MMFFDHEIITIHNLVNLDPLTYTHIFLRVHTYPLSRKPKPIKSVTSNPAMPSSNSSISKTTHAPKTQGSWQKKGRKIVRARGSLLCDSVF